MKIRNLSFAQKATIWMLSIFMLGFVIFMILPIWRDFRGDALLRDWHRSPDEGKYSELLELLDNERLSDREGNRFLQEMFAMKIIHRPVYPQGFPVQVAARLSRITFYKLDFHYSYDLLVNDRLEGHYERDGNNVPTVCYLSLRETNISCVAVIRFDCGLFKKGRRVYSFKDEEKVSIELVPLMNFHEVKEHSNPRLDQQVTEAFRFRKGSSTWPAPDKDPHRTIRRGGFPLFSVLCTNLPIDVGLRAKFVDQNGVSFISSYSCVKKAGESFEISSLLMPDIFSSLSTGYHSGSWILFSDVTLAYGDPLITDVWNGELIYPIAFSIPAKGAESK